MSPTSLSPSARRTIQVADTLIIRFARHWLLYTNLIIFIFMAIPFLAPVLMENGVADAGRAVYAVYSLTCHQLAYRSWFLFGAESSYSVAQLQQHLSVDNPATDLFFWRAFLGDASVGYKMAYCERDAAIYGSMWLATLIYGSVRLRTRIRALSWRWYLLVSIVPMALDGFTQLFGFRESDALLRTITGALFGAGSVWLLFPSVEEAMQDLYYQMSRQLERLTATAQPT
jgi:uncharacterized membrane protein